MLMLLLELPQLPLSTAQLPLQLPAPVKYVILLMEYVSPVPQLIVHVQIVAQFLLTVKLLPRPLQLNVLARHVAQVIGVQIDNIQEQVVHVEIPVVIIVNVVLHWSVVKLPLVQQTVFVQ
jgi:hypothetical protein